MCGIVGISSSAGDATDAVYAGLVSLQHRGQESWGVATQRGGRIENTLGLGLVDWAFDSAASLTSGTAIGHVRYSTTGAPGRQNAQPFIDRERRIAVAHNGNIVNANLLASELRAEGYAFQSTSDSEVILALMKSAGDDVVSAVASLFARLEGAYAVVALVDEALIAFRDPWGFHPLSIGSRSGAVAIASESCALDVLGFVDQREVEPGELVVVGADGEVTSFRPAEQQKRAACVFERIYLARGDSRLDGVRVERTREQLGARLADEQPAPADFVVPVPRSGIPAARGYARQSDLPLLDALFRNDYVARTFIDPDPRRRELALSIKFNVASDLSGLSLVVIDDSIVRGSTMRQIVRQLRAAGADQIHIRIASPPVTGVCHYGVDIQRRSDLFVHGDTSRDLGADSLAYLSLDGMLGAIGTDRDSACAGCLSGIYPTRAVGPVGKLRLDPTADEVLIGS